MAMPNPRNQYLKTQVETASKEQLVVMLFDGIVRFTEQARKAINEGQIEDSHHSLMRAQAIIMELICTVDKEKGGEVAGNLLSLHAYAFNCLIVANMKKDLAQIDEVQKIYRNLREAWVGAMDSLGIGSTATSGEKPAAKPMSAQSIPGKPMAASAAPAPSALKAPLPSIPAVPVNPAAPAAAPKAGGYGMGRTAMLPGTAAPAPAAGQSAPRVTQQGPNTQRNAMLNAYAPGLRSSIA